MLADHEAHEAAAAAIAGSAAGLAGHAWFETYSVLTRLPPPRRRTPDEVGRSLAENFPSTVWLSEAGAANLARRCAELGIAGGSIYDAVIGAVAVEHQLPLLTRDRRALGTYQAVGAEVRVVE